MFIKWEDNIGRATEGETGSTHLGVELLMFITGKITLEGLLRERREVPTWE